MDNQHPASSSSQLTEATEQVPEAQETAPKRSQKRKQQKDMTSSKKPAPLKASLGTRVQRTFQDKWKTGRPWLLYKVGLGMWCDICNRHKNNKIVMGMCSKPTTRADTGVPVL